MKRCFSKGGSYPAEGMEDDSDDDTLDTGVDFLEQDITVIKESLTRIEKQLEVMWQQMQWQTNKGVSQP